MQQPSPRAFATQSNLDSTASCDVTERDSPFPRLREGKGA